MLRLTNASEAIKGGEMITKINASSSQSLAGGKDAITIKGMDTATGAAESITDTRIEGTVQEMTATTGNATFTANDADTRAIMDSLAANGKLNATGNAGDTDREYTLAGAASINLSNETIDITMTSSDAAGITMKANGESIKVTQNRDDQSLGIANALDSTGSGSGATLAKLAAKDELTVESANEFMKSIDTALTQLSENRSELGSTEVQLESSVRNQQVTVVSLNNAESIIRDTDYAAESANFNKLKIVAQAGMYAISQANSMQQSVQKLLQ